MDTQSFGQQDCQRWFQKDEKCETEHKIPTIKKTVNLKKTNSQLADVMSI